MGIRPEADCVMGGCGSPRRVRGGVRIRLEPIRGGGKVIRPSRWKDSIAALHPIILSAPFGWYQSNAKQTSRARSCRQALGCSAMIERICSKSAFEKIRLRIVIGNSCSLRAMGHHSLAACCIGFGSPGEYSTEGAPADPAVCLRSWQRYPEHRLDRR